MKKYLLGTMAVIMAISLSAFTNIRKNDPENAVSLYWFEYDAVKEKTGIYVGFGVREDFTVGRCHLLSGPDCRRGYPATALTNQTDPSLGVIEDDMNEERIGEHLSF